jgi:deoxyribonuclease V
MLALLDVHYTDPSALAACVLANAWGDAEPCARHAVTVSPIAAYEPGKFYLRELPCLLAVLREVGPVDVAVVDGYVWLDQQHTAGLGAHLYEALGRRIPVVGIGKTAFNGSPMAQQVLRATSQKPLFVTSVGLAHSEAARLVASMHGASRIPTLVRLVDQLSRAPLVGQNS